MAEVTKKTMKFRGVPYFNGRDAGNPNSNMSIEVEFEESAVTNYRNASGGTWASDSLITQVTMSLELYDHNKENLAIAALGTASSVASGSVSDESISAPADLASGDRLVLTASLIDTAETVTVTSDPAGTTYTAGTDYTVTSAGILILSGGNISASDDLLVSYTKTAYDVVEALTSTTQEFQVILTGINAGMNGEAMRVVIHRFKPDPSSISLIGDDFGTLTLAGKVLADTTQGDGESEYYHIDMA